MVKAKVKTGAFPKRTTAILGIPRKISKAPLRKISPNKGLPSKISSIHPSHSPFLPFQQQSSLKWAFHAQNYTDSIQLGIHHWSWQTIEYHSHYIQWPERWELQKFYFFTNAAGMKRISLPLPRKYEHFYVHVQWLNTKLTFWQCTFTKSNWKTTYKINYNIIKVLCNLHASSVLKMMQRRSA